MYNKIVQTCRICGHEQAAEIRQKLSEQPIAVVANLFHIPTADLWRCRLYHIEDPFKLYDFVDAAAEKARLLDTARIQPVILSQVNPDVQKQQ